MTLSVFVTWIVVAVITGSAASLVAKNGGPGATADVLLAVAGSGLASGVAAGFDLFPDSGVAAPMAIAIAFVGAVAGIAAQRVFFSVSLV